jgi:hypothetical protein
LKGRAGGLCRLSILTLLLAGCTSLADLKPGVTRGMVEDGFDKTTEGLAFTVIGRTIEEVWGAALRGATAITKVDSRTKIVDQQPPRVIRLEGATFFRVETASYTGIFVIPEGDAIQVQVTKIYKARMASAHYGPSEADYLRAIQRELAPR